jgi:hypothetical protein
MSIIKSGTTSTTAYTVEANTNGDLEFQVNGSLTALSIDSSGAVSLPASSLTITSGATLNGGVVVNEDGADVDFRVEGDTDANLLFVDASADAVGIGTNSPAAKLDVNADALISGLTVGKGAGSVSTNTAVGASALAANTAGSSNAAFGLAALAFNTTGTTNSAFGLFALRSNTTGSNNTALGEEALWQNTTASNNTAVGYQAGYSGTTTAGNAYVGYQAGYSNTGGNITVMGYRAGYAHTTGSALDAFGYLALQANTTGIQRITWIPSWV